MKETIEEQAYSRANRVWQQLVVPMIQKHKKEFRSILLQDAIETSGSNTVQLRIEIAAIDELLKMDGNAYEQMVRDYDDFTHTHNSLLDDPEIGLKLEAQRHFGPTLIGMARRK